MRTSLLPLSCVSRVDDGDGAVSDENLISLETISLPAPGQSPRDRTLHA